MIAPSKPDAPDPRPALLDWYAQHRRDLPWRRHPTPYHVLVSEIMLQQTQVNRVISSFEAFVQQFPTLSHLAAAPRAEVIQAWAGLGYNRRSVYLHQLASIVQERHGGQLPRDRASLLALPGVGPYTAGAILSLGFGEDEPALDTNARRVLSRYVFPGPPSEPDLQRCARELLPSRRAAEWNQALMDLGAALCLRQRPRCLICPLQPGCATAGHKATPSRRPQSPFPGSMRYYRGQLVATLRSLPPGQTAPLVELSRRLAASGVAEPPLGWSAVAHSLAHDGLATVQELPEGTSVGLGS